jgi:FtsZ-binding cell division protein ZapB
MSKALDNLKNTLTDAGDYVDQLEVELEELDEYNDLFNDDINEARDIKDYHESMSDIFDDTYEAEQSKAISEACEWLGWDDTADVEEAGEQLSQYLLLGDIDEVREAVENSDGGVRVADLERKIEELKAENAKLYAEVVSAVRLEDQRCAAIYALGGITLEQHEIDTVAGEEKAYECGLNDGLLVKADLGKSVPLDIIIAPEESDNE